jgi:Pyridine nucleotide-disulphide oxidoreductase, dimerisation domain
VPILLSMHGLRRRAEAERRRLLRLLLVRLGKVPFDPGAKILLRLACGRQQQASGRRHPKPRALRRLDDLRTSSKATTARQAAEPAYGFKVLVEEGTGRVLGAHLVGPHADEVVNVFGLAIRKEITASDLKDAIFAYPTGASDIGYML